MTRSRSFLTIAAVLGIAVCVVTYRSVRISASGPAAADRAGPAQSKADGAPDSAALAELRREIFQLRHQLWAQGQRSADPANLPQPASVKAPDPETRAEQERRRQDYVAGVEAAFRVETRDPQWSAATSAAVQTALAADDELRLLARSVDCRSQTCRVEIADDGAGKLGKLIPMLAQRVGQSLPSITVNHVEDASGTAIMILYMARALETASTP